jgi:hypothetical protein
MDCVVGEIEEKWIVLFSIDKGDRFLAESSGKVTFVFIFFETLLIAVDR